jgi:hypothetical protein
MYDPNHLILNNLDLVPHYSDTTNIARSNTTTIVRYGTILFWCQGSTYYGTKAPPILVASVGTRADLGFNATTMHQQNPNYRPFQQHLQSRCSLTRGRDRGGCRTKVSATLARTHICDYIT